MPLNPSGQEFDSIGIDGTGLVTSKHFHINYYPLGASKIPALSVTYAPTGITTTPGIRLTSEANHTGDTIEIERIEEGNFFTLLYDGEEVITAEDVGGLTAVSFISGGSVKGSIEAVTALAIDAENILLATKTISANSEFTASSHRDGQILFLKITNSDSGDHDITFGSGFSADGVTAPASDTITLCFINDGTNFLSISGSGSGSLPTLTEYYTYVGNSSNEPIQTSVLQTKSDGINVEAGSGNTLVQVIEGDANYALKINKKVTGQEGLIENSISALTSYSGIHSHIDDTNYADVSGNSHALDDADCSLDTDIYKWTASAYCGGHTGSRLGYDLASSIDFGEDDWTIRGWFMWDTVAGFPYRQFMIVAGTALTTNNIWMLYYYDGDLYFSSGDTGANGKFHCEWTPLPDVWYYIEVSRNGDDAYIFIGITGEVTNMSVIIDTALGDIANLPSTSRFDVGAGWLDLVAYDHNENFLGWIDEFQVIQGTCLHTSVFNVPTEPFMDYVSSYGDDILSAKRSSDPSTFTQDITIGSPGMRIIFATESLEFAGGGLLNDHNELLNLLTDTHTQYLLADGSRSLTADWDIGNGNKILGEEFRARDGDGVKIQDDSGTYGIHIEDDGDVVIKLGDSAGARKVTIKDSGGNAMLTIDSDGYIDGVAIAHTSATGTTAKIGNITFGTSATPPTASTVPEGTVYFQHEA